MNDRYKYPEEKFSQARSYLMLPPPGREATVIAHACSECELGLRDIELDDLDSRAREYISRLRELLKKRDSLSGLDKYDLCETINYLAYHFHDRWKEV